MYDDWRMSSDHIESKRAENIETDSRGFVTDQKNRSTYSSDGFGDKRFSDAEYEK